MRILLLMLITSSAMAESERFYQEQWCDEHNGQTEYGLHDRTRVDCLTKIHAIEFDFSRKWSEAIGQSLGYAFETGKQPGIVLILNNKNSYKHWIKLNSVINHYNLPIKTWMIRDN